MNAKKLTVTLEDTECDRYKRMFEAACVALGEIGDALGCDQNESGATPGWVIQRIAEVEARLNFLADEMPPANTLLIPLRTSAVQLASVRRTLSRGALAHLPSADAAHEMGAKGAPATESERLLFEAWMKGHCWSLSATWRGTQYKSDCEEGGDLDPRAMQTRRLWAAWRDRAALSIPPCPVDFHTESATPENTNSTP